MSEHTPGPWVVSLETSSYYVKEADDGFHVCHVYGANEFSTQEQNLNAQADARLIAAAPEMLAALQAFAVHFGSLEDNSMLGDECRKCFALARAAIAKAEGN